jgi:hypothetical protein
MPAKCAWHQIICVEVHSSKRSFGCGDTKNKIGQFFGKGDPKKRYAGKKH